MRAGTRRKCTSPRYWLWCAVLPALLLLAASAQADDRSDPGIGSPAGGGDPLGVGTARAPATVGGADLNSAVVVTRAAPMATGQRGDPRLLPVGIPDAAPSPAGAPGAGSVADPDEATKPPLQGSGVSGSQKIVTKQVAKTIPPELKVGREMALAAINYLSARLSDVIPRVAPPPQPSAEEHQLPLALRGWAAPDASVSAVALDGRLPSPASGVHGAPEASTHQLGTHEIAAGTHRRDSEDPSSSSVNTEGVGSLGSAASLLIPIGLTAAVCGLASPAIRRRLSFRAGWLKPALLASLLEQPG
jgi:hypothetical protein